MIGIPLLGCKLKLSDRLSIIITLFKSLPNLLKSLKKLIPWIEVCCLYNLYLIKLFWGSKISKILSA